jgi:glycosyltransferase involved in cell wall biosynthesis
MSNPRRIGLINQGGADWIGGSEYIRNLILALGQLPEEERAGFEFHLISGQAVEPRLAAQLQPHLAHIHDLSKALPAPTLGRQVRWAVERRLAKKSAPRFSDFLAAEQFDFLYPLTYDNQFNIGVPLPLAATLGSCRWAGWIPDFQHRFMPEFFAPKELARRDGAITTLVGEAPALIFSSRSAEEDFRRLYPESCVRSEVLRFSTSPNPAWFEGSPETVQQQFHLPVRFLLVSNQFWQHKNHAVVFEAMALLRGRGITVDVVCTGQPSDYRNPGYFNSLLRRIHELGIAEHVHLLGLIERAEQIQLMRRCLAVVQPSLFEGWSTVLEDARALGRPVIASDLPVHLEQNPPGCRFFARSSPEELANAIASALPTLQPGPDLASEKAARAAAEDALPLYGRRFLEIVKAGLTA